MFRTYQTKLKNETIVLQTGKTESLYDYFDRFARDFGHIERCLFVDLYVRKLPSNDLKTS